MTGTVATAFWWGAGLVLGSVAALVGLALVGAALLAAWALGTGSRR